MSLPLPTLGTLGSDDVIVSSSMVVSALGRLENLGAVAHDDEMVAYHEGMIEAMGDEHARRALPLEVADVINTVRCRLACSYQPFSSEVHQLERPAEALGQSMKYIRDSLAREVGEE
jgi:hypothetical protein